MAVRIIGVAPIAAIALALLAACSSTVLPLQTSTPADTLGISNGTTLAVTLSVNGTVLGTFGPGTRSDAIAVGAAQPLPWLVEARSPSGRLLTSMTVRAGDVSKAAASGTIEYRGVGARVDLSCGRLDIWVGLPMLGPMPGPGSPGDCAP